MKQANDTTLTARWVLADSATLIENGVVEIRGDRIHHVGNRERRSSPIAFDLGDSILMPGLVNAHCHLDYTDMAGALAAPKSFPDWIKGILAHKAAWGYSDFAVSWIHGAQMLLDSGTTTVADVEAVPELLPDVWASTQLRVYSFLEMTCVRSRRAVDALIREALTRVAACRPAPMGLSPHALYSTSPELLTEIGNRAKTLPIMMHVAESKSEFDMFCSAEGPLHKWLKAQRSMDDCGSLSPVQRIDSYKLLNRRFLAIHANYLAAGDADLLAKRKVHVVHCPRSHRYFRHDGFPWKELSRAGVNIALGTDSLASVSKERGERQRLSLFAEMRRFSMENPTVRPARILDMATRAGAAALGMRGEIGELRRGASADLIAVSYAGSKRALMESLVTCDHSVLASMISGRWARNPIVR